jgi:small subunit ribosomal protein S6
LQSAFRFNDAVIRNLIIERDGPEVEPSPLVRSRDDRGDRGDRDDRDDSDDVVEADDEAA